MANENLEWSTAPVVMIETVGAVKNYLDHKLRQSKDFGALNESIRRLMDKFNYEKIKKEGVGRTAILKFLNGGRGKLLD